MVNAWTKLVAMGKDKPAAAEAKAVSPVGYNPEIEKKKLEFEITRYEEEKRRFEIEREERKKREEIEREERGKREEMKRVRYENETGRNRIT